MTKCLVALRRPGGWWSTQLSESHRLRARFLRLQEHGGLYTLDAVFLVWYTLGVCISLVSMYDIDQSITVDRKRSSLVILVSGACLVLVFSYRHVWDRSE